MKIETIYRCDLCGQKFSRVRDRKPDHIVLINYDDGASTESNWKQEYDLCQECACAIRKVINERNKN